ncbi:Helix-turn-helix protein [Streptomyces sp. YIM 130001]|uniref:helix-turn-helix domain-containing protein n=1 Tax=Streptomyces sp. YIM 130001 TaxID=2259644 RepID=UPI000E658726|nr:helix-turn-helix transcriptional regulator [Streptomyces sp. YIM 130001]RII15307.1 Helix-turn-helix protein [Streptomyces sp. YIM 130001]
MEYDDDASGTLKAVGRQIKVWREAEGLTQAEFGAAIGYGEEMVSAVERGRRMPRPEFLDKADELLGAGGKIGAMKRDVQEARYPKNLRDLAKLEAESVEMGAYSTHTIHALLQTEEYMHTIFGMRRPILPGEIVEREVSARMSRREIIDAARPGPVFSFVLEEAPLRRPDGGRQVQRRQLEHLLEIGQLRNVTLQVMPIDIASHPGLGGSFRLFKLQNGTTLGYTEVQSVTRLFSTSKEVQSLEMQYGNIRAEALRPRESLEFIEKLLGET